MTQSEFPFDTDQLEKGSIIPASTIEAVYRVKRGTDAYGLAAMQACSFVAKRFRDRGEVVTVIQRHHDVVVLTDREAAKHNQRSFWREFRAAARAHARNMGVDRSKLSEEEREQHDRDLEVNGRVLAAVRREKQVLPPSPRARSTPSLSKKT